ncbi:MAG: ABC transporter permease [Proteobacteria bacterium]|nr:ABC transporter permease [Pseudomonadota bacterium]
MFFLKLLLRNALRHKLRTALTMVGLVAAISAFGLLRTLVDAWYSGAQASSGTRLVTRNAISLNFPLPLSYAARLKGVDGVRTVSWANWFGGVYIKESNFFPQFAVDAPTYLALYPEYLLPDDEKRAFLRDRQGAVVGRSLAERYGWKVGDQIPLRGTIYPGTWTFTLRGIWDGADSKTDQSQMLIHWDYLNEVQHQRPGTRPDYVGLFLLGIDDPADAALVAQRVDRQFRNSLAETLTETEKAFQLGFVAMSDTLITAVQAVSLIVITIIMAVMANTMTMSARERLSEYATLKALGFPPAFVARLMLGESLLIALAGGGVALLLTPVWAEMFRRAVGPLFANFQVSGQTMLLQVAASFGVGIVAALWPAWRMGRIDVVQGLRQVA